MTESLAPHRDRGRIILIVALAMSLLLNALALGTALKLRHMRQSLLGDDVASLILPRDLRNDLRAALIANSNDLKAGLAKVVAAREQVVSQSIAHPFDPGATEAAMTALREEATSLMAQTQRIILQELSRRAAP